MREVGRLSDGGWGAPCSAKRWSTELGGLAGAGELEAEASCASRPSSDTVTSAAILDEAAAGVTFEAGISSAACNDESSGSADLRRRSLAAGSVAALDARGGSGKEMAARDDDDWRELGGGSGAPTGSGAASVAERAEEKEEKDGCDDDGSEAAGVAGRPEPRRAGVPASSLAGHRSAGLSSGAWVAGADE